jgi:hypothetical protein
MAISVFLSTVTDEFRAYRDQLVHDLTRQNVAVKVQEDLKEVGDDTSTSSTRISPNATRSCISSATCAAQGRRTRRSAHSSAKDSILRTSFRRWARR